MGVEKYTTASFKFNFLFFKSFKTHSLGCTQPSTRCGRPGAPKSACCSAGCTSARFSWPWPAYRMDTYHCHEFIRMLPRVLVVARVVTAHVFHGLTLHTEWRPIFVCVLPRVLVLALVISAQVFHLFMASVTGRCNAQRCREWLL